MHLKKMLWSICTHKRVKIPGSSHPLWPPSRPSRAQTRLTRGQLAQVDHSGSSQARRPRRGQDTVPLTLWEEDLILETSVCRAASPLLAPVSSGHPTSPPSACLSKAQAPAGAALAAGTLPTKLICFPDCTFFCWKLGEVCVWSTVIVNTIYWHFIQPGLNAQKQNLG